MILVTGGAGYIGSHMSLKLLQEGREVLVYDGMQKGHREACKRIGVRLEEGDIRDRVKLHSVFKEYPIEYVIHFAASTMVGESMQDPLKYYDNNVYGTSCLLDAMLYANVNKIVFSSSAAIYGEPENTPILEDDKKLPTNTYGQTKLDMENMIRWAGKAFGIHSVALRYFNAAGAAKEANIGEDHEPETHLVPLILQAVLGKRSSIHVYGDDYPTSDGTCIRDYIHVSDLAKAHILALSKLDKGESAAYNLGNGRGFTVKEVIEAAKKVTGVDIPVKVADRRPGDPAVLVASSDKIQKELGWKPEFTQIMDIVETAWRWHRDNPDGYRI
jgi:UDP-glucose 4-epimerase